MLRFLPDRIAPATGGRLMGHLHASGDVDVGFAMDELDLSLGPTPAERRVRVHGGRLFTSNNFDTLDVDHVTFEAGLSHAEAYGSVDTVHNQLNVTVDRIDFPDLDVWLRRLGFPAFAKHAGDGKIVITGNINDPTIHGGTVLSGIPCIDKLAVEGTMHGDILDIGQLSTSAFGGKLSGHALVHLGDTQVIEKLHLEGGGLAVARMCGPPGIAAGTLDRAEVDFHGTFDPNRSIPDWLALASVYATAAKLTVYGDAYDNVSMCLNRNDDTACRPRPAHLDDDDLQECAAGKRGGNGFCAVVSATREAGGRLDATIAKQPATGGDARPPGQHVQARRHDRARGRARRGTRSAAGPRPHRHGRRLRVGGAAPRRHARRAPGQRRDRAAARLGARRLHRR